MDTHLPALVAWCAFALAFIFGAMANRVSFCTMGAVSDIFNMGDWRRMRMWLLAIAVAIIAAAALQAAGWVDLDKSIYLTSSVIWLSHLVGGLLFGIGMTLASGCGSKTLIRAGAGNLKSFIVLVFLALSAYMTLKGAFATWRAFGLDQAKLDLGAPQSLAVLMAHALGGGATLRFVLAAGVSLVLLVFVLANRDFRATPEMIVGGLVIGAVIAGGWYVSGHLGYLAEDPNTLQEAYVATNSGRIESYSFVAPTAYALELLLLWTDQSRIVTFGIAGVAGMLLGSTAMALATKSFRWEGFANREDVANHIVGGVLMGFGGVTALGCTVGQGLTGLSTLSLGSALTFFAIIAGCVAALRYQEWRVANSA
jgi:hypothetical protein